MTWEATRNIEMKKLTKVLAASELWQNSLTCANWDKKDCNFAKLRESISTVSMQESSAGGGS